MRSPGAAACVECGKPGSGLPCPVCDRVVCSDPRAGAREANEVVKAAKKYMGLDLPTVCEFCGAPAPPAAIVAVSDALADTGMVNRLCCERRECQIRLVRYSSLEELIPIPGTGRPQ